MNLGFLGQKLSIAGYSIPILYPLLIAGVGAFLLMKGKGSGMPKVVDSAPDVAFNLNPPQLQPNVPTTLSGQFQDEKGMPVTVKQGYYYIFHNGPLPGQPGMKHLIGQGSVGMNISNFSIPLNTSGIMPKMMYSVVVTDIPLTQQELTM